jgi:hypothetical protein
VAVYVCALTPTRARRKTSGRAVENIGRVVKRGWKKRKTKPEKREGGRRAFMTQNMFASHVQYG